MKGKKREKTTLRGGLVAVVVFLLIAVLRTVFPQLSPEGTSSVTQIVDASGLEVHFIDVGQGDATLIKADGHAMLIDAGENDKGTAVQLYLQKQGVEQLDYLVLTHTDSDHIGGADVIVTKFDIGQIFMSDFKKDNKTYRELMDSMKYRHMTFSTPEVGAEYELGSATFTVIAPNDTYEDANNSSMALILDYGDSSFLFSGDCEEEAEQDMLANGLNLDVDVYQVGHHGSKSSSTEEFLDAMSPEYAVISCEEGNSYGHPHAKTLNNLRARGIRVFRTDEQGSIIAYSDGTKIKWNCSPSESWQAGDR
ncbi:MAG: MBL fold metallo-hydrolase [Lachnospiraceae bacterium]|nr:MBL fold metallo-hydrolase [Lachnospiraceae bacterium]MDD7177485.1 ComEC/Rec2 family competence protein [bacterium]MDY5516557.1 ComEC/Rec2 family competence protein [Lachnospiraceae bacterium]